nr:nidogen-2-like isoform X1 [Paramormyrops kingsleyae]
MKMRDNLGILFFQFFCTVCFVNAVDRNNIFPFGTVSGDLTLPEGDDEVSEALKLKRPMYFYETQFSELYVATNGIISCQDLPREKQYVDHAFPMDFPIIAPFLADIDTSNKRGTVYYRLDESPGVLKRVSQEVNRGFPGVHFTATHAVIATWVDVAAYEEVKHSSGPSDRVNTFQVVLAYDEVDTFVLFLYPDDGLHFFGTRPKETYNAQLELPARVGFSRGEVPLVNFSPMEELYYSVTCTEKAVKNLYQTGNAGVPGVWLFHVGNYFSFNNVVPATVTQVAPTVMPLGQNRRDATIPDYTEYIDHFHDQASEYNSKVLSGSEFLPLAMSELLESDHTAILPHPLVTKNKDREFLAGQPRMQTYNGDSPLTFRHSPLDPLPPTPLASGPGGYLTPKLRQRLSKGHSQAIISKTYVMDPGMENTANLERMDEDVDFDTRVLQHNSDDMKMCAQFQQACSPNGYCADYSSGSCCHCHPGFYGNGWQCLLEGAPQRVNGRVSGLGYVGATPVEMDNVDLHSYVVLSDGRAYTAISRLPEPLGWALMPLAPVGGLFGWLFALELPDHKNGFRITGAEFTYHAEVIFYPGNQRLTIIQTAQGFSPENYIRMDTRIHGKMPFIVSGAKVEIEPYKEVYQYYPSLVTSSSVHKYKVVSAEMGSEIFSYQLYQNITFRECQHGPQTKPKSQQLNVERVFVTYIKEEHIMRYAITSKIGPVTEKAPEPVLLNPCHAGTHTCDAKAQCLPGEGTHFQCQCSTGYRGDGQYCTERPRTQCEEHREGLQRGEPWTRHALGTFIPQCDEEGQYRAQQCHGATGHCWCVDAKGLELPGTRTPPGTPSVNCDLPVQLPVKCFHVSVKPWPTQRPGSICERWRDSLMEHYRGHPASSHYTPQCDSTGQFNPVQCYGDSSYCWCVDKDGREVPGTRLHNAVRPACIPTEAPPTMYPVPPPDMTPSISATSLLYAQGQQIGALPLNGTRMETGKASILLALHGSIVVGIDYNCRDKKIYWTDLAGRTINRASLEPGAEPETVVNTGLTIPEGLAVDAFRSTMFWVDSGLDKIETSNLDGSRRRVLFDTELVNPRAIIVDSTSGILFWTDWNRDAPKIEQSTVEGQNRRILVQDGIGLPNALTFNPVSKHLCWADAGTKRLECIAPDGTGRWVIHSNVNYPFGMVFYANHFYYTDWRRDGVIALSQDSSKFTDEFLPEQRSHLYGITVASPSCISGKA